MSKTYLKGFTLAELLISLLILAEIATFTIPKVLLAQQNGQFNAIAKEDISAISGAYTQAQLSGIVTTNTTIGNLTPYLNYVAVDTSSTIDDVTGGNSQSCNATLPCLKMHNGSLLRYRTNASFSGSSASNGLWFHVDPDGVYSGTTNGPGKLLVLYIYYNGRITDGANIPTTTNSYATYNAAATNTPSWFSW